MILEIFLCWLFFNKKIKSFGSFIETIKTSKHFTYSRVRNKSVAGIFLSFALVSLILFLDFGIKFNIIILLLSFIAEFICIKAILVNKKTGVYEKAIVACDNYVLFNQIEGSGVQKCETQLILPIKKNNQKIVLDFLDFEECNRIYEKLQKKWDV